MPVKQYFLTVLLFVFTPSTYLSGMDTIEKESLLNTNQLQNIAENVILNIKPVNPKELIKKSLFLSFCAHDMVKKLTLAEQAINIDPTSEKNQAYFKKLIQLAWYYRHCPTFILNGGKKKVLALMQEYGIEKDTSWKNFGHSIAFILKKDVLGNILSTTLVYALIMYGTYKLTKLIPVINHDKIQGNSTYLDFHDCLPKNVRVKHNFGKTDLIHFDKKLDSAIEECVACAKSFTHPVICAQNRWPEELRPRHLKSNFTIRRGCGGVCDCGKCICHDYTLPNSTCTQFSHLLKNPTHTQCNTTPLRWLTYAPLIFIPIIELTLFGLRKIKQKLTACVRKKKQRIFEVQEQPNE